MNIFKEGSAHDQQCAIFEFVNRWESFTLFPESCPEAHGKTKEEMLADLIDAYFGECMAVQRMIVEAISILYIFDGLDKKHVLDFIARAKSDGKFSTYEKLQAGQLFADGKLPASLSESHLIGKLEAVVKAI